MADAPTSYTYRVLMPILPTVNEIDEGYVQVTFRVLGDFEARTPDAAADQAGFVAFGEVPDGAKKVRLIPIPLKSWHEREVEVETQMVFKVSRPEVVEDPPPPEG